MEPDPRTTPSCCAPTAPATRTPSRGFTTGTTAHAFSSSAGLLGPRARRRRRGPAPGDLDRDLEKRRRLRSRQGRASAPGCSPSPAARSGTTSAGRRWRSWARPARTMRRMLVADPGPTPLDQVQSRELAAAAHHRGRGPAAGAARRLRHVRSRRPLAGGDRPGHRRRRRDRQEPAALRPRAAAAGAGGRKVGPCLITTRTRPDRPRLCRGRGGAERRAGPRRPSRQGARRRRRGAGRRPPPRCPSGGVEPGSRRPAWPASACCVATQIHLPPTHPSRTAPTGPASPAPSLAKPPSPRPATAAPPRPRPPAPPVIFARPAIIPVSPSPPPAAFAPAPQAFPGPAQIPAPAAAPAPPPPPPPPAAGGRYDGPERGGHRRQAGATAREGPGAAVTAFAAPAAPQPGRDTARRRRRRPRRRGGDPAGPRRARRRRGRPGRHRPDEGGPGRPPGRGRSLLRRHGASLDRRNNAGETARDMAAAQGDDALNQALGLAP